MQDLIDILHDNECSCVLRNGNIHTYSQHGVADLYNIYIQTPALLNGADIADRVVGKGAASILVAGKVRQVYADVISNAGLDVLKKAGIPVFYTLLVPNILNRNNTNLCPIETVCAPCHTLDECMDKIKDFLHHQHTEKE